MTLFEIVKRTYENAENAKFDEFCIKIIDNEPWFIGITWIGDEDFNTKLCKVSKIKKAVL